jgi:hypothetical protein
MTFILGIAVGIFVGHVLFHPGRRYKFLQAIDVNGIKGQTQETNGTPDTTNRRSTKG